LNPNNKNINNNIIYQTIMDIITPKPYIECSNCRKQTNCFYLDLNFKNKVCLECLVEKYNGSFPVGKGVHLPCKLCTEPNIRWYHRQTYGKVKKNCGNHGSNDGISISLFD
jgi:hypothetical protein